MQTAPDKMPSDPDKTPLQEPDLELSGLHQLLQSARRRAVHQARHCRSPQHPQASASNPGAHYE